MPTAPPPSRDVALETRFFLARFKKEIIAVLIVAVLAAIAFTGYRYYSDRRGAAAAASLANAKSAQEYQHVIDRYPNSPAAADAYLLLAESQRSEKKFAEANTTLRAFIDKFPQHEFVSTARMAMAANLESMDKSDEALAAYQQIATTYANSFNAPLALLSQVYILKGKKERGSAPYLRDDTHAISNELLGRRGDAAIAAAKAKQHSGADGDAGSDSSAVLSAPGASPGPAKRSVAKQTISGRARLAGAPTTCGRTDRSAIRP